MEKKSEITFCDSFHSSYEVIRKLTGRSVYAFATERDFKCRKILPGHFLTKLVKHILKKERNSGNLKPYFCNYLSVCGRQCQLTFLALSENKIISDVDRRNRVFASTGVTALYSMDLKQERRDIEANTEVFAASLRQGGVSVRQEEHIFERLLSIWLIRPYSVGNIFTYLLLGQVKEP